LTLLRYKSPLPDTSVRLYRSVVYHDGKVVGFSPPKFSRMAEIEQQGIPFEEMEVREYIDGIMVYVYFANGQWHLATRSTPDADTTYRCGTEMPAIACRCKRAEPTGPTIADRFREIAQEFNLFERLERGMSYVFTFMHPATFNVHKIRNMYLIAAYKVLDDARVETCDTSEVSESIQVPRAPYIPAQSFEMLNSYVYHNNEYMMKGAVLYHKGTDTWYKMINPAYARVHALLPFANFNKCLLQVINDRSRLDALLSVFPEYDPNAKQLRLNMIQFKDQLFRNYRECFVLKKKKHKDYPCCYRGHMYNVHSLYLNRAVRRPITRAEVDDYVAGCNISTLSLVL